MIKKAYYLAKGFTMSLEKKLISFFSFRAEKPVYTHGMFWLVVLIPIIIASFFAIPLSKGLVFSRSYESYIFFMTRFEFPLWISSGSIIFGVIIARFHFSRQRSTSIAQVTKQLQVQEQQIKELEVERKSEILAQEIKELSELILKLSNEKEITPRLLIDDTIRNLENPSEWGYEYDYTNKQTKIFKLSNEGYPKSLFWEGPIKHLNVLNSAMKKDPRLKYEDLDESFKVKHRNIAAQINTMIVVSRNLAELNSTYYDYIKNKLANHHSAIQILHNSGLVSTTILQVFLLLQETGSQSNSIKIDFSKIFAKELNKNKLLNRTVYAEEIGFNIIYRQNSESYLEPIFEVFVGKNKLLREDGIWSISE